MAIDDYMYYDPTLECWIDKETGQPVGEAMCKNAIPTGSNQKWYMYLIVVFLFMLILLFFIVKRKK